MGTYNLYDLFMDEEQKIAFIKMEGLLIDAGTIMGKICPIVEDYGMHYTDRTTINTPNYNSAADITAKGVEKYREDREKTGNRLNLWFVPDDQNISSEAFSDISKLIGKKIARKVSQLTKQQIMHSY